MGDSGSPSIETSLPFLWKINCPHPTPQYGQIERATSASSMRACISRVFSDIDSRPVPSLRSRICLTSGHFESGANIIFIQFFAAAANFSPLKVSWCSRLSEQKQTQLDNHADFSCRGDLATIGSTLETAITLAMAYSA